MNKLKSKKLDFSIISASRLELMGIAAVWIVFHHMYNLKLSAIPNVPAVGNIVFVVISIFKQLGPVGLEFFLICSGVGLYYSFSKNSNLKSFYKKRAIRILPTVFIVSFIYYAFTDIGIREYFASALLIDLYTKGNSTFWYFGFIIVMYAVYPLIHKFVSKHSDIAVFGLVALLILIIGIIAFVLKLELGTRYYAIFRVPAFVLSVWIGKQSYEKRQFSAIWIPVCAAVALVFAVIISAFHFNIIPATFTNHEHIYHFLNIPFSVSLVILISAFFKRFRLRFTKAFFAFFGTISMEIYLVFERAVKICEGTVNLHDVTNISFYVVASLLTIVLSVLLQNISRSITSVFTKEYKKINK